MRGSGPNHNWRRLARSADGAVAPLIALSLLALIAAGGVAFDYARLASMDSELQNAADQAALAAVSQLDGFDGACARAGAAARAMVSNSTIMSNDPGTSAVEVPSETACDAVGAVRFYQNRGKTTAATTNANAKFVEVTVNPRTAFYALTPVVGAFSSGPVAATAFAGLGEAICKVPPLMLCNPKESTDPDFDVAAYIGKGIRLVAHDGGNDDMPPGNFGFLASGIGNGAQELSRVLGRANITGNCIAASGVTTEPGNMISVRDALNTRFDIYGNGLNNACSKDDGLCPPSRNTRKDVLKGWTKPNVCGFKGVDTEGWVLPAMPYPPVGMTTPGLLTDAQATAAYPMGYPRDFCHAFSVMGSCSGGRIGDGIWDRRAYFLSNSANYGTTPPTSAQLIAIYGTDTPTRYQVYRHEMDNFATLLQPQTMGTGNNRQTSNGIPVCTPPGITPSATQLDRRVISAAVINCTAQGVKGRKSNIQVADWIDLFLVEPALDRPNTETNNIYVELIGLTDNATDEEAIQQIKKSVPYLIE